MQILNVRSKIWEEITGNAKKCLIDEGVYIYIDRNLQQNNGVVFDVIGQVKGLIKESQYFPMSMLSDDEQACLSHILKTSISLLFFLKNLSSLMYFMLFLTHYRRMPKS